ncbi:hypothetical protein LguiB_000004 [Lonicera macranthoides]
MLPMLWCNQEISSLAYPACFLIVQGHIANVCYREISTYHGPKMDSKEEYIYIYIYIYI